ncbi:hypothetical protein WJX77_005585 [Trebouxia sp. C0004]
MPKVAAACASGIFFTLRLAQAQQVDTAIPGRLLLQTPAEPECDGHRCSGHSSKLAAHGWINAVTWGIVFPLVILLAHSLRRELNTWWFHLHRALSLVGLVLAIAGAASGGNLTSDVYRTSGQSAHKALGILAVVAAALQAISSLIWRPLKAHRWRGVWDLGHHWLGRLAFVLAVAAVFTGIYIAAVGWGYYVAYGATLAAFLLLVAFKDIVDIFMGHKLQSVTVQMAARRKSKEKNSAVAQTTDIVASHTGDKWTENAGGLYPYLKTKRGKEMVSDQMQQMVLPWTL